MSLRVFASRFVGAALLDADRYEEIEADRSALGQACLVVALTAVAGAVGGALASQPPLRLALDALEPFVLWTGGSAFAYMVGATFLRGVETVTDYAEVLRTVGFAFAPGLLRFFVWVSPPTFGTVLPLVGDVWMLAAGVVAIRQALDFTTPRAIATFGLGYALLWLSFEGLLFTLPA